MPLFASVGRHWVAALLFIGFLLAGCQNEGDGVVKNAGTAAVSSASRGYPSVTDVVARLSASASG